MKNEISIEVLTLKRLRDFCFRRREEHIIKFSEVFTRICPLFFIIKDEAWAVLRSMEEKGFIKIVPFHGIKILETGKGQNRIGL